MFVLKLKFLVYKSNYSLDNNIHISLQLQIQKVYSNLNNKKKDSD